MPINRADRLQDVTAVYKRALTFPGVTIETVAVVVEKAFAAERFTITGDSTSEATQQIMGVFGTRLKALLYSLIPIYGHLNVNSWRMRLICEIASSAGGVSVRAVIAPLMALFDEEPIPPFGIVREYYLSKTLERVWGRVVAELQAEGADAVALEDSKHFWASAWWRYLLYNLEPFGSPQPIHRVKGTRWSWGAFLLPEVWFPWNELWGESWPYWLLDYVVMRVYSNTAIGNIPLWVWLILVIARVPAGLFGKKLYYMRYGRWR